MSEKREIEKDEKSIGVRKRKKVSGPPQEVELSDVVKGGNELDADNKKKEKVQLTYTFKVTNFIAKYLFWFVMCPFVCGLMAMVLHPASVSMERAFIFALLLSGVCLLLLGLIILVAVFGFEILLFAISVPVIQPEQEPVNQ